MGKSTIPKPPDWLNSRGVVIYKSIIQYLETEKLFDNIDWMLVAMASKSWVLYEDATKSVLEGNVSQKHSNGIESYSIDYQIMRDEGKNLDTYFRRLGIGVESRDKIKNLVKRTSENEEPDEMEQMMNEKRRKPAGS